MDVLVTIGLLCQDSGRRDFYTEAGRTAVPCARRRQFRFGAGMR